MAMQGLLTSGGGGGSAMSPSMWIMMAMVGVGFAMSLSSLVIVGIYVIGGNGGVEGPAGPTGLQGATGATGAQGPQGEPGTSFISSVENWLQLDGEVLEVGGLLTKSTALDVDSYDLVLSSSGDGSVTVETPNLYMTGVQEDTDASAPSVLVLNNDSDGLVEYTSVSDLVNSNGAVYVVYTNGVPTSSATRFSVSFPPTSQDNSLKLQVGVPYCAATGNWYESDGVTYTSYTYTATRSTIGNHASFYRTSTLSISSSTATTLSFDGTNSMQGPAICPTAGAGAGYNAFTLAPGAMYSVRASIFLSGTAVGICSYAAYVDGSAVAGSTGTTFTWSYNTATSPTSGVEMFTVIRVPTVAASLTIRTTGCTGTGSYTVGAGTKVLIQQISVY